MPEALLELVPAQSPIPVGIILNKQLQSVVAILSALINLRAKHIQRVIRHHPPAPLLHQTRCISQLVVEYARQIEDYFPESVQCSHGSEHHYRCLRGKKNSQDPSNLLYKVTI